MSSQFPQGKKLVYSNEVTFSVVFWETCLLFRRILAPGEEEDLDLDDDEDAGACASEAFASRAPGTVNPAHLAAMFYFYVSSSLKAIWPCTFFVLSVGVVHVFIAHPCLPDSFPASQGTVSHKWRFVF